MSAMIGAGQSGRRRRLSLVLALMLGLLASLIHCGSCDLAIAGSSSIVIAAMDGDGTAPSDAPDTKMAFHHGHCLSHVTGQSIFAVQIPADVSHHAPRIGHEQTLASLAGLPLFKPPRA
ncbi:MAG: ferrichrome ABC transporter substrate-binding protein [Afipia sp.]